MVRISASGFLIFATSGTVASALGWPTARIITGFSLSGRSQSAFRNFIGLGVWVSAARPGGVERRVIGKAHVIGQWQGAVTDLVAVIHFAPLA
jgi:hypothetical protein